MIGAGWAPFPSRNQQHQHTVYRTQSTDRSHAQWSPGLTLSRSIHSWRKRRRASFTTGFILYQNLSYCQLYIRCRDEKNSQRLDVLERCKSSVRQRLDLIVVERSAQRTSTIIDFVALAKSGGFCRTHWGLLACGPLTWGLMSQRPFDVRSFVAQSIARRIYKFMLSSSFKLLLNTTKQPTICIDSLESLQLCKNMFVICS